jgi:hypothetical protein
MGLNKEKLFYLIIFLHIILIGLYLYVNNSSIQVSIIKVEVPNRKRAGESRDTSFLTNQKEECAIIKKDQTQYQVKIDGSIYPKRVSLHLNKSIDFDC